MGTKAKKRQSVLRLLSVAMWVASIGITMLGLGIITELQASPPPPPTSVFLFNDSGTEVTILGLQPEYQNSATIIIPTTINGKLVTKIEDGAFNGNFMLTSVTLPDVLKSIGSVAFADTGLADIIIPLSVTEIGAFAFGTGGMVLHAEAASKKEHWDDNWCGGQDVRWSTITATFIGPNNQIFKIPYSSAGIISLPTVGTHGFTHDAELVLTGWIPSVGAKVFPGGTYNLLGNTTFTAEFTHINLLDKSALGDLIVSIQALGDNETDDIPPHPRWTLQSWDNLMEKLDDAITVFDNPFAMQENIRQAYLNLFRARWDPILGLRPYFSVERKPLIDVVGLAQAMVGAWEPDNNYMFWTKASWDLLLEALENAEEIVGMEIHDERAPQSAVNKAYNDLNSARRNLEPIKNFELPPETEYMEQMLGLLISYVNTLNRGDFNRSDLAIMAKWYALRDASRDATAVLAGGESEDYGDAFYTLLNAYRDLMTPEQTGGGWGPISLYIVIGVLLVVFAVILVAFGIDLFTGRRLTFGPIQIT